MITLLFDPRWRRNWRLLLLCLLAAVSWFAFMPSTPHDGLAQLDKLRHLLAFASLALVAALGWPPVLANTARIAGGLMVYGLFIELMQTQLPTRTGSAADWLADAIGIGMGLLLHRTLRRLGVKICGRPL